MKLIKPSYEIMSDIDSVEILKKIELIGKTCYKSEDKITKNSAKTFVVMILRRGHESVIEHESLTVRFICDRGVTHELVRHRLCSFSQESTRFCNYKGGVTFIIPPWIKINPVDLEIKEGEIKGHCRDHDTTSCWLDSMLFAEKTYIKLISAGGWTPQQARSVLPNSLKTEIVTTATLREWRHILRLRTSEAAHPQIRELMIPLLVELKSKIPIIFDDIEVLY